MLFLLQLLILTGFFIAPNDSMERHTLNDFILEENLQEIVEKLSSKNEKERNEGIYKMVELFTGRKNAKKEDYNFTIPAEKAKEFLKKVFLALKNNNVIMPKVKEMDKKWICAAENQPKNSLKAILEGIFNIKFADQLKKYSKNFKPFLMILSAAIRICAIFGSEKDQYSLEAFLMAYKCANVDESQQPMIYSYKTIDCPPLIIYSYKILAINNNGQLLNFLPDEIASIKFCKTKADSAERMDDKRKTKTDSAERNFNFFLKLSDVDITPFSIVKLAKDIRSGIVYGKMVIGIDKMKLSQLAGAHFAGHSFITTDYEKKNSSNRSLQADFDGVDSFCLSNFLLNLLNRTLNLPNLEKYFVDTDLLKELKAKQCEARQKLFCDRFNNNYNQKDVESWKDEIVKREHYLHFEDAIHINLNPNKEMFILIQLLKFRCFCSTRLYDLVPRKKDLYSELRNECDEMKEILESEGKDRNCGINTIAGDEQNELLTLLETLKNFEQIKNAYKKLKTYCKKRVEADNKKERRCTDKEEKDGYKAVVELNEEFRKAFEKVLEEF